MEKVIQIDEYSKGDIFGVESLLDEQPFGYTGTTLIPTEIIIINFEEIYKFLSSEFRGSFRNEIKTYPEEEAMRKMYLEKSRWKKFKTKFLNEQIYENKLKAMQVRKQGFINMLSPKAKRKMMLPPDLIEYVKGSQKESFVDVLDRINKTT